VTGSAVHAPARLDDIDSAYHPAWGRQSRSPLVNKLHGASLMFRAGWLVRQILRSLPASVWDRVLPYVVDAAGERAKFRAGVPTVGGLLQNLQHNGFQPQTVIDIGANVGDWSRAAAALFSSSRFLMVDANPDNEEHLRAAQRDIPKSNYVIQLLGAEHRDAVRFHVMGSGSSVFPEVTSFERRRTELGMTTLDELIKKVPVPGPALMKLDVQGYELEILRGGNQALEWSEVVILEIALITYNEGAPLFAELVKFMDDAGFVVYDFCGQSRRCSDHALFQTDVVFVKNTSELRKRRKFLSHEPELPPSPLNAPPADWAERD